MGETDLDVYGEWQTKNKNKEVYITLYTSLFFIYFFDSFNKYIL